MEVNTDAMFLISISYQALKRIEYKGNFIQVVGDTQPCDEIVTIVFLGIYLEASITYIINKMEETKKMNLFYRPKGQPVNLSLFDKFAWFYNEHIEGTKDKCSNSDQLFCKDTQKNYTILEKLDNVFHGFRKIYDFRNDISHGNLDEAIKRIKAVYKNTDTIGLLREDAKKCVDILIDIAHKANHEDISKNVPYNDALIDYKLK